MLASRELCRACEALQSQATTSVATPAQLAAQAALEGPETELLAMRAELERRRDLLLSAVSAIPGLRAHKPRGAFYLFVSVQALLGRGGLTSDDDVASWLLERARVAVVPGSAFGTPGYVRLSYATSQAELERAAVRIAEAVKGLGG
jgi:aspartate aminotransferase